MNEVGEKGGGNERVVGKELLLLMATISSCILK